jgi:hypothetical protein
MAAVFNATAPTELTAAVPKPEVDSLLPDFLPTHIIHRHKLGGSGLSLTNAVPTVAFALAALTGHVAWAIALDWMGLGSKLKN